jgi:hypothetical protein
MKCDYCKDGVYFGLQFFETCTYCNGSGVKDTPLPPPTHGIMVDQIETLIMDLLKQQVQGQYNPALIPRGGVELDTVMMLNLDPALNPTIDALEKNTHFLGVVAGFVRLIDNELFKIHGGQWIVQKAPLGYTLGMNYATAGLRIDWTNPGKNPRRLHVKGTVSVG